MNWNRIGRRIVPLALTAAMCIPSAVAADYKLAVPSGYKSPFIDVQSGDWYYKYVAILNSQGVIDGYGNGEFGPNDSLTSGAALIMILKTAGHGTLAPSGTHWASGYADYALSQGYLTAEEMGDLDQPMERLHIAHLAAKALGLSPSQSPSPFADVEDGYLTALYEMGIITGSKQGNELVFLPNQPITRAEISVIVWQVDRFHTYGEQIFFQGGYYNIQKNVPINTYQPDGFYKDKKGYMHYQGDGVRVVPGIDVSVHQAEIDWKKVADSGVEFAMIRVGYRGYGSQGRMMPDKYFEDNIQGALDAGLEVGIYYFSQAITVEEAIQEAEYVLEEIAPYSVTYPVVFDWERQNYSGSRTQKIPSTDMLCQMANAFCQKIEEGGYQPMVYFYQSLAYNNYDLSRIMKYPFWLAEYDSYPSFYYHFDMLQYTSSGRVPGISGDVDLNLRFFPA